jgi:GNAT superfamily N-acetyltransferase
MSCSSTTRRAVAGDALGIAQLYRSTLRDAYAGEMPADFVDPVDLDERATRIQNAIIGDSRTFFITLVGDVVVGFCGVAPARDEDLPPGFGEVVVMAVEREHRRHGHGLELLCKARHLALKKGWSALALWVVASNVDAGALYARAGFVPDGGAKQDDRLGFTTSIVRCRLPL